MFSVKISVISYLHASDISELYYQSQIRNLVVIKKDNFVNIDVVISEFQMASFGKNSNKSIEIWIEKYV